MVRGIALAYKFQSAPSSQTGGNPSDPPDGTCGPLFQSAPSSQTGGNVGRFFALPPSPCFNPPPVRKPEETHRRRKPVGYRAVSIRPQFANRRKQAARLAYYVACSVSIRPQFANRRKLAAACGRELPEARFNPPPVRKPEETTTICQESWPRSMFQSAPSSQTGGNIRDRSSQHEGFSFNPPPVRKPEETRDRMRNGPTPWFQSAPSSQTGGNCSADARIVRERWFQSAPSSQTGGNRRFHRSGHCVSPRFQSAPSSQTGGNDRGPLFRESP